MSPAFTYSQSRGTLTRNADGALLGTGYSGHGEGKNNPAMEAVPFVGPCPCGLYEFGPAYDHTPANGYEKNLGPLVMDLTPVGHDALGRTEFKVHGDSAAHPGEASEGCIVQGPAARSHLNRATDRTLEVVP